MSRTKINLLLSYLGMASISAAIITPALPKIQDAYSLTNGSLEWVISIFLFGYVIAQLLYGPLSNRYGRVHALRTGLWINLIGIVLCILSSWFESFSLLLIGRFVTALGAAAGLCCTFTLINELLPKEQARHAMSFTLVSITIGLGLAVTLGGIVTQYLNWQDCFWILFIHGIIMLCFTWQFPETLKQPLGLHPLVILTGYRSALKNKKLVIFSMTLGLCSMVAYGYSAVAPMYAQSILKISAAMYGYWNLINMAGMLGSGFLSAHLVKRYGMTCVLWLGFGLLVPCIISLILIGIVQAGNPLWFFITTAFLYLSTGLLFPSASFFASNAIQDKASASGMMSFINMSSAMIAVIIIGYLPMGHIGSFTVTILAFFILTAIFSLPLAGKEVPQE